MKKIIFTFTLLLCFSINCFGICTEQIKRFYIVYLTSVLYDNIDTRALKKDYLTEEMLAKAQRLENGTGGDAIIRAQDTTEHSISTLKVTNLRNNWYMVSYLWNKNDSTTLINIPLKAQDIEGHCKITYITPIWYGSQYGDKLLSYDFKSPITIDHSSAQTFLESFYKAYVSIYCAMSKDLIMQLASMRSNYLSKNAMRQFKDAELDNLDYKREGYDLLIKTFDFDCMSYKTLQFIQLNDSDYQITYSLEKFTRTITVSIKQQNGKFMIDQFIL